MDDHTFQTVLELLYEKREYRPEAVAILYDSTSRVLVTQSYKDSSSWCFPQEGIHRDESRREVLERGLREELGISLEQDLDQLVLGVHFELLGAEPGMQNRRGFTAGKAYFASCARYIRNGQLHLKPSEVAVAQWMTPPEAREHFFRGRPAKAELSMRMLHAARRPL